MRGKDPDKAQYDPASGITPAHAGKSSHFNEGRQVPMDHPRACGEKHQRGNCIRTHFGSPPRMRGKDREKMIILSLGRITPAHAGKSQPLYP